MSPILLQVRAYIGQSQNKHTNMITSPKTGVKKSPQFYPRIFYPPFEKHSFSMDYQTKKMRNFEGVNKKFLKKIEKKKRVIKNNNQKDNINSTKFWVGSNPILFLSR